VGKALTTSLPSILPPIRNPMQVICDHDAVNTTTQQTMHAPSTTHGSPQHTTMTTPLFSSPRHDFRPCAQ